MSFTYSSYDDEPAEPAAPAVRAGKATAAPAAAAASPYGASAAAASSSTPAVAGPPGEAGSVTGIVKLRGMFKKWHTRVIVLQGDTLAIYKDDVDARWNKREAAIVLKDVCEIQKRTSKKEGFCFKIRHRLGQGILAGAAGRKVDNAIFRVPSKPEFDRWFTAIKLVIDGKPLGNYADRGDRAIAGAGVGSPSRRRAGSSSGSSASGERKTTRRYHRVKVHRRKAKGASASAVAQIGTNYVVTQEDDDEGPVDDEIKGEDKGIVKMLLKQVRPGMDLSKVVLPVFILENRSFLQKITDYFAHNDLLARVAKGPTPEDRMCRLVKWFLSGFYLGPKGVKKPYNPIIGEFFRSRWVLPPTDELPFTSRTHFYAEQVSHHPPISAFYCSNRAAGFTVNGSIRFKSKFQITSVLAMLFGTATLTLNDLGEEYIVSFPKAKASGWFTTLKSEIIGEVELTCPTTGYSALLDFKPKPLMGGQYNAMTGEIRKGTTDARGKTTYEVLHTISGAWNERMEIVDTATGVASELWDVRGKREALIPMEMPPMDKQDPMESRRLWQHVTRAINEKDNREATEQKYILEKKQRDDKEERDRTGTEWQFKMFRQDDPDTEMPKFTYGPISTTPFDFAAEDFEYEEDCVIRSKMKEAADAAAAESYSYEDVYTDESYDADEADMDLYALKRDEFLSITAQLRAAKESAAAATAAMAAMEAKVRALEESAAAGEKAARAAIKQTNKFKSDIKALEDATEPEGWFALSFLFRLFVVFWLFYTTWHLLPNTPNLRFWQYFL